MSTIHYSPKNHIQNLTHDEYYRNLILLRNEISSACDDFFRSRQAPKVDLFMIARGISSPMGKGSDSEPVPITIGTQSVNLVDSAQFGMEPLVLKHFKAVYCYLPSFRGEDSDARHLTQFYHCEAEIRGNYKDVMNLVNDLVKSIIARVIDKQNQANYPFKNNNFKQIKSLIKTPFPVISFDEAAKILNQQSEKNEYLNLFDYGRVITSKGEAFICQHFGGQVPVWIEKYDRDTVPFYQKPDPENTEKVLNADLIFPSINGGFGGEIIGAGQRQDSVAQLKESMSRQNIKDTAAYNWYLELRNDKNYQTTSGFGLGIERLIAWMLGTPIIAEAAIYPVQKNVLVDY